MDSGGIFLSLSFFLSFSPTLLPLLIVFFFLFLLFLFFLSLPIVDVEVNEEDEATLNPRSELCVISIESIFSSPPPPPLPSPSSSSTPENLECKAGNVC